MESADVVEVAHDDVRELTAFADDFEAACGELWCTHAQLNAAMEERVRRLTLWDDEEEARYRLRVDMSAALASALTAWQTDADKRRYTQQLIRSYYDRVASGTSIQAEIDGRRARLASTDAGS
ncbi:hypothetical protein NESM_000839700 [Novymonas esmeraldas]|uniref:Uncharacterized protein n=1 Tax=Novymonas esmeraldas TaxID=1808958 RepID=A0AAW0EY20_9TRYP